MQVSKLAQAIRIFAKYAGDDLEEVRTEHDELYIGNTEWTIDDADKKELADLGFSPCDEGCYHAFT